MAAPTSASARPSPTPKPGASVSSPDPVLDSPTSPFHGLLAAAELSLATEVADRAALVPTLSRARVDLLPHQVEAALFALGSPLRRGVILADEVGLGKTVEAGLVMAQLLARGAERMLVVVPASLRAQWQSELEDLFGISARILDGPTHRKRQKQIRRPFEEPGITIVSLGFAYSRRGDIEPVPWDLVVIDEAHRLRNVYRPGAKRARALRAALGRSPKLLLTATPLQNSLLELFGLVSFIDRRLLGNEYAFRNQFCSDEKGLKGKNLDALRGRLEPVIVRTLRRQVREYVRFTSRHSILHDFEPSRQEQELYERVSEYLMREQVAAIEPGQRALLVLIYRKLLASSSMAIAPTLRALSERVDAMVAGRELAPTLFEDLDGFAEQAEEQQQGRGERRLFSTAELRRERDELRAAADLAASIQVNAKALKLRTALREVFALAHERGWPQKAVVFTESRRTADYISGLLRSDGLLVTLFTGAVGGAEERRRLIEEFREKSQVLVATEAGGEGLNLQFANIVVNYDLPWNPQRIEQRIGRCHRYGQRLDVVVVNFLNTANAADKRLYELLRDKLMLFDGVFGSSDELLGALEGGLDFERRVLGIYQGCRDPDEIDRAFEALRLELDGAVGRRLNETRTRLVEHFDADVAARLQATEGVLREGMAAAGRRVLELLRGAGAAVKDPGDGSLLVSWPDSLTQEDGEFPKRVSLVPDGRPGAAVLHAAHPAVKAATALLKRSHGPPHVHALKLGLGGAHLPTAPYLRQRGRTGIWGVFRVSFEGLDKAETLIQVVVGEDGRLVAADGLARLPVCGSGTAPMLDGRSLAELAGHAASRAEELAHARRSRAERLVTRERHCIEDYVEGARLQSEQRLAQLEQRIVEAQDRMQSLARDAGTLTEILAAARATLQLLEGERRHALRQRQEDEQRLERERTEALDELESLMAVRRELTPVAFARFELV